MLYAEGAGEVAGAGGMAWHTNSPLDEDSLGAAHELVRRWASWVTGTDESAMKLSVARSVDLDGLALRCRAFRAFRADLRRVVRGK
ncbi:MAG: hypothetical protein JW940_03260 [Polyangiaceae bacterium]|nr:hypothetical protein [Polyangiaceae bacterium]